MKLTGFVFSIVMTVFICHTQAQTLSENIRINQVGFFAEGIKKAVAIDFAESNFEIWTSDQSEKVYTGKMTKRTKWEISGENNVQITSLTGEVLFEKNCSSNKLNLSLVDFASGLYFIKLTSEKNKVAFVKIVKY